MSEHISATGGVTFPVEPGNSTPRTGEETGAGRDKGHRDTVPVSSGHFNPDVFAREMREHAADLQMNFQMENARGDRLKADLFWHLAEFAIDIACAVDEATTVSESDVRDAAKGEG